MKKLISLLAITVIAGLALLACAPAATPSPSPAPPTSPPRAAQPTPAPTRAPTKPPAATKAPTATKPPAPAPKTLTAVELAALPLGEGRQKTLEEGARREGALLLYTSSTGLEPLADKFMEKYPFVKMEVFATRGEPLTQRTLAEAKAGRLNGDVIKTNIFVHDDLKDLLVKFNSPHARFDRVANAASLDLTGIAFTYSKKRVAPADVPTKVEDLLKPRWKQNIGLFGVPNNYAGRWVGALVEHLGEPQARDFLRKLGDQKPYFYTQPQVARNGLLAGEWDINMQGMTSSVVSVRKGDPLGWVALDPTTLSPDVAGIFKLAPHPHAAMLFLDFIVAPEGQALVSGIQGSVTQEELEKREKEGVKLPARITFQAPSDVPKVAGWMKMFEELVMKK